jgi:hypothetical protein
VKREEQPSETSGDQKNKPPRYFERPDASEKPHSFFEILIIVMSTHLGVRPKAKREDDFRRANGLHLFIAGIIYFALLIAGLIFLVRYIVS